MQILPLTIELDYVTILKYLRPPTPTAASLWWTFATITGLCLLFAAFEIISRRIARNRRIRRSQSDFDQLTIICQLTPEEIRLLRNLIDVCGIRYPDRLFTSFELFNRCLEDNGPLATGLLGEPEVKRLRMIRNKILFGEHSRLPPIKTTRELKSNQWLHLKRLANGKVFMAPVIEAGENGLLVATPRVGGVYLEIKPGEQFDIYFWRERDAGYRFVTRAIGQTRMQSLVTIFKHVEDMERTQRRRYHRIETSIPVEAVPVTREELDNISQGEAVNTKGHPGLHAYVVDVGPAGFALAARAPLAADDLVYIELPSEDEESAIRVIGKIVSVTERKTTDEFLMHAEFAGMRNDTQEKLFHFLFSCLEKAARPVL